MTISIEIKLKVLMSTLGIPERSDLILDYAYDFDKLVEPNSLDNVEELWSAWTAKIDSAFERALYRALDAVLNPFHLKADYIAIHDELGDSVIHIEPNNYDWIDVVEAVADFYIGLDEIGIQPMLLWWFYDTSIPNTVKEVFEGEKVDLSTFALDFYSIFKEEFYRHGRY